MKLSALLLSFIISSICIGQNTLTPESLWELKRIYGESVSPDQKSIIFSEKEYQLEEDMGISHLYIMGVDGNNITRISDGKTSVYDAHWRPDGQKIGYLSAESGIMQLWEMNPNGTEAKQISSFSADIANWQYSPDMKNISYTMDVKIEESLADKYPDLPKATGRAYENLMFRHWTQWHDYSYSHILLSEYVNGLVAPDANDIMQSEPYDSPMNPFGGSEQITWSKDGKSIFYVCKKLVGTDYAQSTNSEIYQFDLATQKTTNLTAGNMGYDNEPVLSPDGSKLAWMSMARNGFESDKNDIRLLDLKTGTQTNITNDIDQTFGSIVWSAKGDKIYALSPVNATYQIFEMGIDKNMKRSSFRAVTKGEHNINSIHLAGDALIGTKSTISSPNALYSWNIKTGKETKLSTANNEMLASTKMGKVEKRMIKTSDGKDMLTWVIYPPDFDPTKKYPTLLYCQGGPQSAVSQFFSYRWNFQLMAANGYIVVAPNRRGLPSFGQKWNDDISKDWGGQAVTDYLSAIDEVAKEPFVDNDKIGAVGASYGGYSVYYLAGVHEGRFKTFISHCGLFNLESWYASTEELFFANWDIGGPYWESPIPESYKNFSPHKMVGNWDTPIMVIHNELDFRVPLNQGLEAFTAAQIQGIPSKLLYYPDEGHWVLKPQNGVMWHREFYGWLDQWLK